MSTFKPMTRFLPFPRFYVYVHRTEESFGLCSQISILEEAGKQVSTDIAAEATRETHSSQPRLPSAAGGRALL